MIQSLYVHIPFCIQKCLYCDFNSYTCIERQEDYLKALEKELSFISDSQTSFETIFVGGGTPTVLTESNLEILLQMLAGFKAKEYTFESNPGTLTREKLKLMKTYGVNRISIGLQSSSDRLLRKLGRIHCYNDFLVSFQNARDAGFDNINIDIMFGIPDQNLQDFNETLDQVLQLDPEHISCYGLILEEGTPFYSMEQLGKLRVCDEEEERSMYHTAVQRFLELDFIHYEISNFSKPGKECRHNLTYWNAEEYYGAGAGAHSYLNGVRDSNPPELDAYMEYVKKWNQEHSLHHKSESLMLTLQDQQSEFMFLGLRLMTGISKAAFYSRFLQEVYDVYGIQIRKHIEYGLLVDDGTHIALTLKGIDLSNQVFVDFI